jgi:aerobic carbon-monoxide dehydrogenase medium subunit
MKDFEYYSPSTLAEAIDLCQKFGATVRVMAGGTELINEMRKGTSQPGQVIDLKRIAGMDDIEDFGGGLKLGGLVRIHTIENSAMVLDSFVALRQAARTLGSVQVRSKATLAGNICRASPSADMVPPLIALRASVRIRGKSSDRVLPLEELFVGPGKTVLTNGEILTEIHVPKAAPRSGCAYLKLSPRRAMDLAVVGVAAMVELDKAKSICLEARIALGAVGLTAVRARNAEAVLKGSRLSDTLVEKAGHAASLECDPITDIRASEMYRREMVRVMVKRAVRAALSQVEETGGRECDT